MVANQKVTGKATSIPGGIGIAATVSMLITLLTCCILAWLVVTERVGENAIGYCAMMILLVSSFVGAVIAAVKIKHRKMMVCVLSGCAYFLCLLACTALFFGGQYHGVGVSALLILAGSVAAALTDMRKGGSFNKKSRRKMYSR